VAAVIFGHINYSFYLLTTQLVVVIVVVVVVVVVVGEMLFKEA